MIKSNLLVLLPIAMLALGAGAKTLVLSKTSDNDNSFYAPADWIDENGATINSSPQMGDDYVVANGLTMSVNSTTNFTGRSLQFGYVGGTSGYFLHQNANKKVTVDRLILANGYYRAWQSTSDNPASSHILGNTEIVSPRGFPFFISPTHKGTAAGNYLIHWDAKITGEVGTGFHVGKHSPGGAPKLVLTGDNSGYYGAIAVSGENLTFRFTQASALGGQLPSFDAEALTLDDQCIFECSSSADSETLLSSVNRGMKVKSGGAKINVPAGKVLRIEWPVALEGLLEKTGEGEVVVDSLAKGEGGVVFLSGGLLTMNVENWNLAGSFSVKALTVRGDDVPFLKVPISAGEVKPSDFTIVDDFSSSDFVSCAVVVSVDGNYQVASLRPSPVITTDDGVEVAYAVQEGESWSDDKTIHQNGDYVVGKGVTFSVGSYEAVSDDVTYYSMPESSSLTFDGGGSVNTIWKMRQKIFNGDVRITGSKTRWYACGNTAPHSGGSYANESMGDIHVLKGRLHLGAGTNQVSIYAGNLRTIVLESEISGSGVLELRPWGDSAAKRVATYVISGTNSFKGRFFAYHDYASATNIIRFSNERNLGPGSALESVNSEIFLQGKAGNVDAQQILHPIGSVRVALPNRKLYFYSGNCGVRVDGECEFKWDSNIDFRNGNSAGLTVVTKSGGGVWAVGGEVFLVEKSDTELKWTLNVDEGYIRADNARAFSGMTVTFAEGAGIAAKYNPDSTTESAQYGMIVTDASRFTISGAKLLVKVDTNGDAFFNKSLPVLTVPADAADAVGAKLKGLCDIPMGGVSFVRESVTLDDAQYVRFSAEVHRGTVITVR